MAADARKRLVVVGLGMVGVAFIEKVLKLDARSREWDIVVVGEEPHLAYNRVGLTSFFDHRKVENLYLNPQDWYTSHAPENKLGYHLNTLVTAIDPQSKTVTCSSGDVVAYDVLVLATGSDAVLPRHTPGHDANGVFVYRTIADLERLIAFGEAHKGTVGAVVGGGLLGLEAAKAMMDLDCFAKVALVERNRWVLSRQLDQDAGALVVDKVSALGVDVLLSKRVGRVLTDGEGNNVTGVVFEDGEQMACSTICFAIGVRPRDSLARSAGIQCADRGGGIIVGDDLSTNVPDVYAIGECASWQNQTFGLIAPGVEMADVLSFNLTQAKLHRPRVFKRPDLSTKLKLLGVDVASFGDFFADRDGPSHLPARAAGRKKSAEEQSAVKTAVNGPPAHPVKALTYKDPFQAVYKKYLFTTDGKYLLGGMMIGDTSDYIKLVPLVKNQKELDMPPSQLILGAKKEGQDDGDDLEDDTQICSCHNVTKGDVVEVVKEGTCKSLGDVKACTKAGTGCGGCMPLVTTIFNKTMRDMGAEVTNHLCSHFGYSRADLYNIVMVKRLKTLADVMREAGNDGEAEGCEACKPAVASIFASLWNRHVMDRTTHGLQETNDRFLGNIQRNGTFSVVPRVSAGEITPDKLIVIGQVAKKYGLYTKITGGQRIDMFGAKKQDLLAIWKELVDAGMESGHAYAKSLRTVKSCVGTTWCRYGIGDSVGMAVRLEERYKSIRAPHKIKGGVSGCVRECAEAQNKEYVNHTTRCPILPFARLSNANMCLQLRTHSHRERLQHLRRRQRRRQAQALGAARQGRPSGRGDTHPGPVPDVLHPHRRQAPAHGAVDRAAARRPQVPAGRGAARQAGHLRVARGADAGAGRLLLRRVGRGRAEPRDRRQVPAVRQHGRGRRQHGRRAGPRPVAARHVGQGRGRRRLQGPARPLVVDGVAARHRGRLLCRRRRHAQRHLGQHQARRYPARPLARPRQVLRHAADVSAQADVCAERWSDRLGPVRRCCRLFRRTAVSASFAHIFCDRCRDRHHRHRHRLRRALRRRQVPLGLVSVPQAQL
ncbi:hypothetical protein KJ359_000370 [Pestalotiopsis sp. 9143b]|nr:hypothetical protein KJ359_000370 [Pestalotiopsis sp. 9143b]